MFIDYFLYGTAFGMTVSFGAMYLACMAYSRMSGRPSPMGTVATPEPLPFHIQDDRNEAALERQIIARDTIEGLGRG